MKHYLSIILRHTHPFKFLVSRLLMKSGVSKFMTIRLPEYSLRFFPTPLMAEMWIDPDYVRPEERFIEAYVKPGDSIVDVGANIGLITLLCAKIVGPHGAVHAIEANPRIFTYLKGNITLNSWKHVTCTNVGVSNSKDTILFTDNAWDEINAVALSADQPGVISIPAEPLDTVVSTEMVIDLLKIDVEGFEKFVIEGASGVLRNTRCIYFESNMNHFQKYGYRCADLYELLKKHSFVVYRIVDGTQVRKIDADHTSVTTENLIAVRDVQQLLERTHYTLQEP